MRRTFLDDALEARFQREGYVTLRLLDEATVAEVARIYDELRCDLSTGWHADLFSSNLEYRRLVHERVGSIFRPRVLKLLDRFRHYASIFVVKEPAGEASKVPMHQDWTIVDYRTAISINVVCPLVDTNAENGWLMVVPGSHQPPTRISFAPIDRLLLDGEWEDMAQYIRPLALKAGEAVIYDGRLLHGSPPNRTERRRVAFSAGFIPEEAELTLWFQNPEHPGKLEQLGLPDDFFMTHRLGDRPENSRSRGFIEHHNDPLTEAQLKAWVTAAAERVESAA